MSFTPEIAFNYLKKAFDAGRLGHAYLVTGSEGSGKEKLASKLIALTNRIPEASLEDMLGDRVRLLEPRSKSRMIKVEDVREFERSFYMGSAGHGLKVGILRNVDRMGPSSGNAFLKTLEEPPVDSLFLLITAYPEQLLPTILSRCIRVALHTPAGNRKFNQEELLLLKALEEHFAGGSTSAAGALALKQTFSEVLASMNKEIVDRNKADLKEEAAKFRDRTDGEWLKDRDKHYDAIGKAEYLTRRQRLLDLLFSWAGDVIRQKTGYTRLDIAQHASITARAAEKNSPEELVRRLEAIENLQAHLETNVNEGLALEVCFMEAFG